MKRRSLVAVLCMLSMLAFAGCGKKTEDVAEVTETEDVAEVEETETVVEEEPEVVEEEPVHEVESNRIESFDDTMIENILHIETAYAEFLQDDSLDAKDARKNDEAQHTIFNEDIKVEKAILSGYSGESYEREPDYSSITIYIKGTTETGEEKYKVLDENTNAFLGEGLDNLSVGYKMCTTQYYYDTLDEAVDSTIGTWKNIEILDERDFE